MVWGLFPIDSLRGAQRYYIFLKGTYKVGRKDCDIVVQTDTAVSRLHAEIVVDKMTSRDPSRSVPSGFPTSIRVRDRSKFGTFINKELGSKALHLRNGQDATVKDGDSVTFGSGNATFRLCFVPLVIFTNCSKISQLNASVEDIITSIGAYSTSTWSPECTHVLVDNSYLITLDLIEAVVAKKPIVLTDWLKVLIEKNIRTEFPSFTPYVPTISLEDTMVNIVEHKVRENCLETYTFVLGSIQKYKFGDKLQSLLEVVHAKLLHVEDFCSSSQTSADGENNHYVLVIPGKSVNEFNHISELSSLSRITDMNLVAAILSGNLESSIIEPPPIVVSSSHSTDETIVADSDVEMDDATSNHKSQDAVLYEYENTVAKESEDIEEISKYDQIMDDSYCSMIPSITVGSQGQKKDEEVFAVKRLYKSDESVADQIKDIEEKSKHDQIKDDSYCSKIPSVTVGSRGQRDEEVFAVKRLDKSDESVADRHENSDIIFSQDLIVRDISRSIPVRTAPKTVVNFKCFRKKEIQSGNSFRNLIPFSRDPYKESNGESNELTDCFREEKKRKQLDSIAEDLFNNEKGRKRANAVNSLHALFSRS